MKRFLIAFLLCLLIACPALAENRVIDRAEALTSADKQMLEETISLIQQKHSFDVVLLTETSIGGAVPRVYAADFYEAGGYGFGENHDGIILLLVLGGGVGNRDYTMVNTGRAIKIFNESAMDDLEEAILPYLRMSNYSSAFSAFVNGVDQRLAAYVPSARALRVLPFTLLGGLVVGLIVSFILKYQMKTVRRQINATSYIREGSFDLSRANDLYLYTTTTRRRIETSSGTRGGGSGGFHSSSGSFHTSRSGKF